MDFVTKLYGKISLSDDPLGCWNWLGADSGRGYGRMQVGGVQTGAHRASYEHFYGVKIPEGMFTDHICRNRKCVRPDHLRVVTPKQNSIENSTGICATNSNKTHCKEGHALSGGNLIDMNGVRVCRACSKEGNARWYVRNKSKCSASHREWAIKNREYLNAYQNEWRRKRTLIKYLTE